MKINLYNIKDMDLRNLSINKAKRLKIYALLFI
ncbi:hypothetical protein CCO0764 [Campylobacter coli RM2228]|nr:hypothetical protein CCO0764 [Campylobacter coli RM2228]